MTREEIEQEILGYSVKELVAACVGLGVAMQDVRAKYGNEIGDLPEELATFVNRFIDVAEEQEKK